jgi:hypothetical protein
MAVVTWPQFNSNILYAQTYVLQRSTLWFKMTLSYEYVSCEPYVKNEQK